MTSCSSRITQIKGYVACVWGSEGHLQGLACGEVGTSTWRSMCRRVIPLCCCLLHGDSGRPEHCCPRQHTHTHPRFPANAFVLSWRTSLPCIHLSGLAATPERRANADDKSNMTQRTLGLPNLLTEASSNIHQTPSTFRTLKEARLLTHFVRTFSSWVTISLSWPLLPPVAADNPAGRSMHVTRTPLLALTSCNEPWAALCWHSASCASHLGQEAPTEMIAASRHSTTTPRPSSS